MLAAVLSAIIMQSFQIFQLLKTGEELVYGAPGNGPNGRTGGGLGCQACHSAPEFDIDPNSGNNGVVEVTGNNNVRDITVTRSPTLRDLFNTNGQLNGPLIDAYWKFWNYRASIKSLHQHPG